MNLVSTTGDILQDRFTKTVMVPTAISLLPREHANLVTVNGLLATVHGIMPCLFVPSFPRARSGMQYFSQEAEVAEQAMALIRGEVYRYISPANTRTFRVKVGKRTGQTVAVSYIGDIKDRDGDIIVHVPDHDELAGLALPRDPDKSANSPTGNLQTFGFGGAQVPSPDTMQRIMAIAKKHHSAWLGWDLEPNPESEAHSPDSTEEEYEATPY